MRTSSILLVVMVLVGVSFLLPSTVGAQTPYITVHGQLSFSPCTSTSAIPPTCQYFFYLITNGSTPGIPTYPTLDFSQSLVPPPSQSDVGKVIAVTGYYGQEPLCLIANGCFAFFVHLWGPYFGPSTIPTTTGCFIQANSGSSWQTVQCVTAPTIPLVGPSGIGNALASLLMTLGPTLAIIAIIVIVVAYIFIHRKK